MFKHITKFLLLLLIPVTLHAQIASEPQPIIETIYVSNGVADPNNPGQDLPPSGNWGFRIEIKNTSDRPISCLKGSFKGYLKLSGDDCSRSDTSTYINQVTVWPDSTTRIVLGPNETYPPANFVNLFGNQERIDRGQSQNFTRDDLVTLSYCGRDSWAANCGYDCPNGKHYDEKWDESIAGGSRKYKCSVSGEVERTLDKVSCRAGFSVDPVNDRCIPQCDIGTRLNSDSTACEPIICAGGIAIGQARVTPIFDGPRGQSGQRSEICLAAGYYDAPTTTCSIDWWKVGESCEHKSNFEAYKLSSTTACNSSQDASSGQCRAAVSRWCARNYGYETGLIQQVGATDAAVGCYHPTRVDVIQRSTIAADSDSEFETRDIYYKLSKYCEENGLGSVAIIKEEGPNEVIASCTKARIAREVSIAELKQYHSGCWASYNSAAYSSACRAAASNYCAAKGGGFGVVQYMTSLSTGRWAYWPGGSGYFYDNNGTGSLMVACIEDAGSIYKLAPW